MSKFSRVIVIYNPNSTGNSQKNAEEFAASIKATTNQIDVTTLPTKYAGHAEEIATKHAGDASTLIVSSSGDGGYNEVINGVLEAGGSAATAVLPSGNANDHHRAISSGQLVENIAKGKSKEIDVISVKATQNGRPWQRYAHSYVGFGITPKIGNVLTKQRPNILTEKWYVLKHLLTFRRILLIVGGKKCSINNLVFSTITGMSKVVALDEDASINDGKMEVYQTLYQSLPRLLYALILARLSGLSHSERVETYAVTTIRQTLIQLDGEVFTIDAGSEVVISCKQQLLRTVV